MLAPKSTHKRKRSSTRSDKARKLGAARWIVNLVPSIPLPTQPSATGQTAEAQAGPSHNRRLERLVHAHPFNRSLELILPLVETEPRDQAISSALPTRIQTFVDQIRQHASRHRSYRARVPLSMLLDPVFVTAYLRTGSLVALTAPSGAAGLSSPPDDTVCLDGQGTLVLSLCKDTYQTLGLTGRASHFSRLSSGRAADRTSGPDSRFIVELPLLSPSFVPGKRGYQQALDRLRAWDRSRARLMAEQQSLAHTHASSSMPMANAQTEAVTSQHATWDMLFVWSPNEAAAEAILRSDPDATTPINQIRFPDHLVRADQVQELSIGTPVAEVTESVWVPLLNDTMQHALPRPWNEAQWPDFQADLEEAIEWAGMASLGADAVRTYAKPDSTCVYGRPRSSQPGRTLKLSLSGATAEPVLLSALLIAHVGRELDALIADSRASRGEAGWATMAVSGFPHSPLTWRAKTPLSSVYGATTLPGNKASVATGRAPTGKEGEVEDVDMTDASEEEEEEDDVGSDSSLDMGEYSGRQRKTKKRSRRTVRKNHTEHAFTPSTGETGWISFCLDPTPAQLGERSSRWILVELVGTDTRS